MRRGILVMAAVVSIVACQSTDTLEVEPIELTEEYGCGYGFYSSNSDQTVGLFLDYGDYEGASSGRVSPNGEIGATWNGELRFGTDLFANWCDDVLEQGEPTAEVTRSLPINGRVEMNDAPGANECGIASANLVDLVAVDSEREDLAIGDLEVTNEFWGCFAG